MNLIAPPIQIYHPVFAKFLSRASLPFDGDDKTLRRTSDLLKVSCVCYKNEASRMLALRRLLADLVHDDMLESREIDFDDKRWMKPDATIFARPVMGLHPVCAFLEVKNEIGTGGCSPLLQCQSDFVKLCSSSMVSVLPALDHQFAECHSTNRLPKHRAAPCFCWQWLVRP